MYTFEKQENKKHAALAMENDKRLKNNPFLTGSGATIWNHKTGNHFLEKNSGARYKNKIMI